MAILQRRQEGVVENIHKYATYLVTYLNGLGYDVQSLRSLDILSDCMDNQLYSVFIAFWCP